MPTASRGQGRVHSPGSFWKPGVLATLVNCSPHLVVHLNPRSPGQGLPPSLDEPGPAVSADVLLACAWLCAWPPGPHAEFGSYVGTKGSQQWGPCPNVPVGCTPAWVTGLCPAQPALCPPRELGHHGACPPPGPVFGTESPHCPAPPPPAGPGQHRGPGRKRVSPSPRGGRGPSSWGGAWLRWNNDSFLEAKDTTTGMEGR